MTSSTDELRLGAGTDPEASAGGALKLARDTAWYGASAAVAKALALLTVPFLTRALTPEGYGLADLATSTAALLTLVAMLSADIPAARLSARADAATDRVRALSSMVWVVTGVGLALALALLPLSAVIADVGWGGAGQASLVILSLMLVPISAAQASLAQTQRILGKPRTFAVVTLVDLGAQLALAVAFVVAGLGPDGVVLGFIAGSVVGLVAAAVAGRDVIATRPGRGAAAEIARAGLQFLPFTTAFVVADWITRAIVANSLGVGSVAQFGVALRVASALTLVGSAFALAWGPMGLGRERGARTAALFGRALLAFGAASFIAALALAALGPELVAIAAGEGYDGAWIVLPGLALAAALAGTEYVLVVAAGISDRGRAVAVASVAGALVQVVAATMLLPTLGLAAIGPVALLGRLVSFAILYVTVRRDVSVPEPLLLLGVVAGVASALAVQAALADADAAVWLRLVVVLPVVALGAVVLSRQVRSHA